MLPVVFTQGTDKYQSLVADWTAQVYASGLGGGGSLDGVIAIRLLLGALTVAEHRSDAVTVAGLLDDELVRS